MFLSIGSRGGRSRREFGSRTFTNYTTGNPITSNKAGMFFGGGRVSENKPFVFSQELNGNQSSTSPPYTMMVWDFNAINGWFNNSFIWSVRTNGTEVMNFGASGAGGMNLSTLGCSQIYLGPYNNGQTRFGYCASPKGLSYDNFDGVCAFLAFGGSNTPTRPALKVNGSTTIQVRLADDSGDADLSCRSLNISGSVTGATFAADPSAQTALFGGI